ncbi:SCO family protein [Schlesneria sp. T3-172]|uniref:SCO family protein n=1 Tax=Schlesneria sphaerica TaxID=3373610 RepID=UPI0037C9C192
MNDQPTPQTESLPEANSATRKTPLLLIGSILWGLCLIGIILGWYQWRKTYLARLNVVDSNVTADDDGRSGKVIKLVPQNDGTVSAVEVTPGSDDNPWSPDGIEDFSFTDTDGNPVTKADLLGKPFIIAFIFTYCRGPCPNVTREMREISERLKEHDFHLVSLTVDPKRDTTEVLKAYGEAQQADFSRWKFLTGDQAEIYGLIQRSFLMPVQEELDRDLKPGFEIIHSTNIMLVDATGRVIGKFNAQKPEEVSKLRRELKRIAPLKTSHPS